MTVTDYQERFQIGRVVSRTFGVISRNLVTFLAASVLILLPMILLSLYNGTPSAIAGGRTHGIVVGILAFVVQILCTYLLQATLVQGTITDLNGDQPSLGNALSTGFGVALPVFVISILAVLGMMLGMILLVVPGVMLAVAWSVAVPVRVIERTGIGATFGRSRSLTKGSRWSIFWLVLMYAIVAILLTFLTMAVTGVALGQANQATGNVPYLVITWLEQVVLAMITAVGVTAIYYELRTVKEGVAPQQLAAAFD